MPGNVSWLLSLFTLARALPYLTMVKKIKKIDVKCIAPGAGKSSVVSALLRLVEIEAGAIVIDSLDIRTISLRRLRSAIGLVPQTPFLFEVGPGQFRVSPL